MTNCDVELVEGDCVIVIVLEADALGAIAISLVICLLLRVDLFDVLVFLVCVVCLFAVVPGEYLVCLPFGFIADIAMFLYGIVCIRTDMYT